MKKIISVLLLGMMIFGGSVSAYYESYDSGVIISEEGTVYKEKNATQDGYKENGNFTVSDFTGSDDELVKVSSGNKGDSVTMNFKVPNDYYEIYYWKSVFEDGDENASYTAYATGLHNQSGKIDFSKGMAGWVSLGVLYCSDGHFSVTITANNGKIPITAAKAIKRNSDIERAYSVFKTCENVIMMKVGERNTVCNKQAVKIADIPPEITDNTTFVPVRFVTENMNGNVEWIGSESRVNIKLSETDISFVIGSREYFVNGEKKTLDVAPYIKNGRTMIPLRAMSEGAGKTVKWDDSGLIVICDVFNMTEDDYKKFVTPAAALLTSEK